MSASAPAQVEVVNEYALNQISFRAHQFCRQPGFNQSDHADLCQDMTLYLLSQANHFDPERASLNTFISCVIDTAAALIQRARWRDKRIVDRSVQTLSSVTGDDDGSLTSLATTITDDDLHRRNGSYRPSRQESLDNIEAVEHVLKSLPPKQADICRRLMDGTVTSVARELGISRRQVRKVVAQVREALNSVGFELSRTDAARTA